MSAKVLSNLESVGDMVGALRGISDGLEEDSYIEGLVREAHGHAANVFDVAAVATAEAGLMTHVFEFGNPGITAGRARFADPTAPEARLWVHRIIGEGKDHTILYSFRPATQPNPQPAVASTGVSSKYLAKLSRRKYIFWNKAFVMETGQTVSIKAQNSDFLFVPFRGPSRDPKNKKGFVMYNTSKLGPITATPGETTEGTFTMFWMNWWGTAGQEIMEKEMRLSVTTDIEKAEKEMEKKAASGSLKPVQTTNIIGASNSSRSWMKKLFGAGRKIRKVT